MIFSLSTNLYSHILRKSKKINKNLHKKHSKSTNFCKKFLTLTSHKLNNFKLKNIKHSLLSKYLNFIKESTIYCGTFNLKNSKIQKIIFFIVETGLKIATNKINLNSKMVMVFKFNKINTFTKGLFEIT